MTSSSVLGSTSITIQFELDRNIDAAAQDVQAAITRAGGQLPRNLPSPPSYTKVNPADSPILIFALQSDVLPLTVVDDYTENVIAQRLSQVSGVAQVMIAGQQKPAIRVQVDPVRLAAAGLGLEDVRSVIAAATTNSPKGLFDGTDRSFTIYDNDQITKAEQFEDLVLAYHDGAPIRVRDIGRAVAGAENTRLGAWEQNGKRGIELVIFKQANANVIDTVQRIRTVLPDLLVAIPPSIHLFPIVDRTQTIRTSVADVQLSLFASITLVVIVIWLFLQNSSATLIPTLAIPLSLVGTFAAMYVLGYSIDNLSLLALTISVGFIVDDAIVMLENIYRHIQNGMQPKAAALQGSKEIGFTIVSMSLSLVAVFIPLLLMSGVIGRLFREFAICVSTTILISAIVSLTLTPMLCSRYLRHASYEQQRGYTVIDRTYKAILAFYERTLVIALDRRRVTFSIFLLMVASSIGLYVYIPKGFFPQQDTGAINGSFDAAQDVSFAELVRLRGALGDIIARDPDVATYGSIIGFGSRAGNSGGFFIGLKPRSERTATAMEIIDRLRPELANVVGVSLYLQANQDITVGGRASRTQFQYTLEDASLEELNEWAPRVLSKLKTIPTLRDVVSDQQTLATTATLTINRDQAARFGIQPQLIDDTLYDAFGQRQVAQYYTQLNTYNVVLEISPVMQKDVRYLDSIYVKSPMNAQLVPLSAFVKTDTRPISSLSINHQGQFPAVTLSFNLANGAALGDAVTAIEREQAQIGAPPTLHGTFQGTAQAFQASLASQPYLIAAAIVAVYVILGVLYESYIYPLTILSTLPSAGVGALLMLIIAHYDLSVIALIGVILLIGIVKKNGIMMVDFAIRATRVDGDSPTTAIHKACLLRFRPILMTSVAALLGGVPLMLGQGAGSELRRPLGLAVVGGLLVSQLLTLYTTPVIFIYLERLRDWLDRSKIVRASHEPKLISAEYRADEITQPAAKA